MVVVDEEIIFDSENPDEDPVLDAPPVDDMADPNGSGDDEAGETGEDEQDDDGRDSSKNKDDADDDGDEEDGRDPPGGSS